MASRASEQDLRALFGLARAISEIERLREAAQVAELRSQATFGGLGASQLACARND